MHINHTKAIFFSDNAGIKVEHLKNTGFHLNRDGMRILAANFINQALKVKIKPGKCKRKQDPLWLLAYTLNKMIRTSSVRFYRRPFHIRLVSVKCRAVK